MRAAVLTAALLALAFPAMAQKPNFTYDPAYDLGFPLRVEPDAKKSVTLSPYAYRSEPEPFEAWADGDPMIGAGVTYRGKRSSAELRYEQQFGRGTGSMYDAILPPQEEKFGKLTFRFPFSEKPNYLFAKKRR